MKNTHEVIFRVTSTPDWKNRFVAQYLKLKYHEFEMSRKFNNAWGHDYVFGVNDLSCFLGVCTFTFILVLLTTPLVSPAKTAIQTHNSIQDKSCAQSEVAANKFRFVKVARRRWQWLAEEELSWLEGQARRWRWRTPWRTWRSPMAPTTFSMSSPAFTDSGKPLPDKYSKELICLS